MHRPSASTPSGDRWSARRSIAVRTHPCRARFCCLDLILMAGEQGFEPWNAGIKIQCLNQLGDSPTQPAVRRRIFAKYSVKCNVTPIHVNDLAGKRADEERALWLSRLSSVRALP